MSEVILSREILRELEEIGKRAYPNEGCAILLGDTKNPGIKQVKELKNTADKELSKSFFQVNPIEILDIEKEKNAVITGFFHTHPDQRAVLSKEDEDYMIPGIIYVVMSIVKGSFADIRAYVKEPDCGGIREFDI